MLLATGHSLSFYEILGPLGAGAMGEVYRAKDTRLGREVAIKVLPVHFAVDEERLRRFEREAKSLASLNHPNVAQIHGVDQVEDTCFLVLELVPGETLEDRIARGALSIEEALDVCRQIAEGLEAAHEAGVMHRDLKPANVIITPDGRVKILDFGLAKPLHAMAGMEGTSTAESDSFLITEEGRVLGTPTYMSPEQARGKPVDKRTDIWAFGCVLFECLTGKRAFKGEAYGDLIAAILEHEPTWSALPDATPAHVRSLLQRCLDKDSRPRLRDIGEARVALGLEREDAARGTGVPGGFRRRETLAIAALALVVGLAAGAFLLGRGEDGRAPAGVVPTVFRQVSDLPGPERQPCLSPDGKSLLFVYEPSIGNADIYLQRVEGRTPINLTPDSLLDDSAPAFSPDGEQIAFRSGRNGGGIFVMGATGESVRRVTDFGFDPAWSPDGSWLAVTTEPVIDPLGREYVSELWVVAADGSERRQLTVGDAVGAKWSPDGRRIACWGWRPPDWQRDIFTIAADGTEEQGVFLTDDPPVDWSPVWSPAGDVLYFGSNRSGTMNLWRIDLDPASGQPTSAPTALTTPSGWSGGFSVSADGSRLAYATRDEQTDVLTVDFDPQAGAILGSPKPIFGGRGIEEIDWSPSGDRLVISQIGQPWESLAIIRADGSGYTRITDASAQHRGLAWQPGAGNERILFFSNARLMTIRSDGSDLRPVDEAASLISGIWSGDGRQLLTNDLRESNPFLTWSTADFGRYELGVDGDFRRLDWSARLEPDLGASVIDAWNSTDDLALMWGPRATPATGLHLVDLNTGAVRQLFDLPVLWASGAFLPDGKRVLFKRANEIMLVDSETLELKVVLEVEQDSAGARAKGLSLSRDGRKLAILARRDEGDIWVVDLETRESRP